VESSLRRAIAANPNWFKPHWMLAQQLRRESRLEEAGKEAALAAELDSGHHPEVAQTLVEVGARQTGSHAP
jgi:cytochrome c-type biogenesis protein CcmH/NrfG